LLSIRAGGFDIGCPVLVLSPLRREKRLK